MAGGLFSSFQPQLTGYQRQNLLAKSDKNDTLLPVVFQVSSWCLIFDQTILMFNISLLLCRQKDQLQVKVNF